MRMTSIILPTCNGLELLQDCVASIRSYTQDAPYEIIVVDNGSTDGTLDYCRREALTLVSLPHNVGFPAACNKGIKVAKGDAILLLNNDIIVSVRWLNNLLACLDSAPDIGIVGPYTNYASGKQMKEAPYSTMEEFQRMAEAHNIHNPSEWKPMDRIVGLCFLFKRELLDRIGYLDERFSPGHYEDDDYCYRARLAGYRLMLGGDVYVHHHGSASFKRQDPAQIYELITGNHRKFIEKWGVDPHQFI